MFTHYSHYINTGFKPYKFIPHISLQIEITGRDHIELGMLTFSFFKRSFRYENNDEKSKTKRSF